MWAMRPCTSLTSLLTSDDTREAHSFLESDQYYPNKAAPGGAPVHRIMYAISTISCEPATPVQTVSDKRGIAGPRATPPWAVIVKKNPVQIGRIEKPAEC